MSGHFRLSVSILAVLVTSVLVADHSFAARQSESARLSINGTVRLPGTRAPVPEARVKLREFGGNRPVEVPGHEETIGTDGEGRFSFAGLLPGRYLVSPVFPGDSDGVTHVAAGRVVELAETGLPRDVLVWWIEPVSELSGRVLGPDGEPVAGACVTPRRLIWFAGNPLIGGGPRIQGLSCVTGDDGRFRIGATPGRYLLLVEIPDENGNLVAPPQYYPGTFLPDVAAPVTVSGGTDLTGLDVLLVAGETFRVTFEVRLPEFLPGLPEPLSSYFGNVEYRNPPFINTDGGLGMVVRVRRVAGPGLLTEFASRLQLEPIGDGRYALPPLPPGEYEMLLTYPNEMSLPVDLDWKPYDPIARIRFRIADEDVDLGRLPDPARFQVSGRVVVRRSPAGTAGEPSELPEVSLEEFTYILGAERRRATPAGDGTFLIENAYPGPFMFWANPGDLPDGWYVESVRSGGIDLLRDALLVGGGPVSPVEVVIANDAVRIEGVVRDGSDQLVPDARVILIPPFAVRGPLTQFPEVEADASGVYTLERVPPGQYRLLALDLEGRDPNVNWDSPDFLRQYELRGELITLDPGARLTIDPEAIPLLD